MQLIEITYPENSLDADTRAAIAHQVASGLIGGADGRAPQSTMQRARAMTHVVFHPAQNWTTGDGPLRSDQPTPFLVTVTVPDAWRNELSAHAIGLIRSVLEQHSPPGDRTRHGGDIWINVIGVRDGSIGLNGNASTAEDVLMYMTEEHRRNPTVVDLPEGVVADPICGMQVQLGPDALTLEHDGTVVGFCSKGCRATYARQHGIRVNAA